MAPQVEVSDIRDWAKNLDERVAFIIYRKANGELTDMIVTKYPAFLNAVLDERPTDKNPVERQGTVTVWAVDRNNWRTLKPEAAVLSLSFAPAAGRENEFVAQLLDGTFEKSLIDSGVVDGAYATAEDVLVSERVNSLMKQLFPDFNRDDLSSLLSMLR